MSDGIALALTGFQGVNIKEPPGMIDDRQLVDCDNYNVGRAGELVKRTGFETLTSSGTIGSNAFTLLGYFRTDVFSKLLGYANGKVYQSTDGGTTWTEVTGIVFGTVTWGVQYGNKFYFIRSAGTVVEWDGSASPAAIAGSPTGTHAIIWRDRLFVLNTDAAGALNSRVYFTLPGDLTATGWVGSNTLDVQPGEGDPLIGFAIVQDILVCFKSQSVWLLYTDGAPADWVLRNSSPSIGCISKYTVKEIEGLLYFMSAQGVYVTDGNTYKEISVDIAPAFQYQFIDATTINKSTAAWFDDKYILQIHSYTFTTTWSSWSPLNWNNLLDQVWDASNQTHTIWVYHLRTATWTKWSVADGYTFFNFLEIRASTVDRGLYIGDRSATGKCFKYGDTVYQDDTSDYVASFETKEYHFDSPNRYKRGKWLGVDQQGEGEHTYYNVVDGSALSPYTVDVLLRRSMNKVPGPGYFRTWRFRAEANHSAPDIFYGVVMQMHQKRTVVRNAV